MTLTEPCGPGRDGELATRCLPEGPAPGAPSATHGKVPSGTRPLLIARRGRMTVTILLVEKLRLHLFPLTDSSQGHVVLASR